VRHSLTIFKPSGLLIMSATAHRLTAVGGTAILVCRGIVQISARSGSDQLGGHCHSSYIGRKPGKNPCDLSFVFQPLIGADLTACFGGRLPVLMAGDLNAKHMDWNSQLITFRGKSYVILPTRNPF